MRPAAGAVTEAASRTPPASTAHVNAIAGAFLPQEANTITGSRNIEWMAETANAAHAQPPMTGRRTVAQWRHHRPEATAAVTAITAAPNRARSASVALSGSRGVVPIACTLSANAVQPRAPRPAGKPVPLRVAGANSARNAPDSYA